MSIQYSDIPDHSEVMAKRERTIVVRDVASESDMKGVIVIVVCYMYAIFLFITAALCAQIFKGIKSSFSELLTHTQIVEVQKKDKYDYNHNIRTLKHCNVGAK